MQKVPRFLLLMLILNLVVGASVTAKKITYDPSAPGARPGKSAARAPAVDTRLAQKVTIECVNVRLHTALEQISSKTGVTVNCGKNTKDWPVRDLPIVVCVKDVPLGDLLHIIADTMHLRLTSSEVEGVRRYRIWRDLALENELADYERKKEDAVRAVRAYDWDVLCRLKDFPDKELRGIFLWAKAEAQIAKSLSTILPSLDSQYKERFMSGKAVDICAGSVPAELKDKVVSIFQQVYTDQEVADRTGKPFEEIRDTSFIQVRPRTVLINLEPGEGFQSLHIESYRNRLEEGEAGLPPRPKMPDKPGLDTLTSDYPTLKISEEEAPPFLQTKVKLEAPENKDRLTYADVLAALSKASDYSVVFEDFHSHRFKSSYVRKVKHGDYATEFRDDDLRNLFGKEMTIREILDVPGGVDWHFNETHKMIIGIDQDWTERAKNMVPESLVESFNAKFRGQGVDLDDLGPIAGLTPGQIEDWFSSPDTPFRDVFRRLAEGSLWPLYYSLSASDRKLAKSEKGLPLAKYSSEWLREGLRKAEAGRPRWTDTLCQDLVSVSEFDDDIFADPDVFASAVMRVKSYETESELKKKKNIYQIEIASQKSGRAITRNEFLVSVFPISQEEITAARKKRAEESKTGADKRK